jgi:Xaa-Pro aminopeptidase
MRYTYLVNGARDAGYRAIIASGANIWYGHYKANNAQLTDGDLVLVDAAPDYHYYTSDIGRMWPVNGRYTDAQRELYGLMVEYHKTFLALVRPGVTAEQITSEAAERMRGLIERTAFSKPLYQQAARKALEFPYHMSHPVGMAVHDVGHYRGKVLRPGMVLSLDPSLWVKEERLYFRVEDTLLITESGIENFTADAPLELDDVEQTIKQGGMLQQFPALW